MQGILNNAIIGGGGNYVVRTKKSHISFIYVNLFLYDLFGQGQ